MNWLNNLFSNADGVTPWWGILLAIVVLLVIGAAVIAATVFVVNKVRRNNEGKVLTGIQWTARELVFGALCIAIAFALSYLRFFKMPQGGSITPASMLPIMMFAYIYGTPKGLIVGLAYGLLQLLQDAFVVHWAQLILDYCVAFTILALAGLFRKSIYPGMLLAGVLRYAVHVVSGIIFFAEYAGDQNVLLYSMSYNSFALVDLAICIVIAAIPPIHRMIESLKNQAGKVRPVKTTA